MEKNMKHLGFNQLISGHVQGGGLQHYFYVYCMKGQK